MIFFTRKGIIYVKGDSNRGSIFNVLAEIYELMQKDIVTNSAEFNKLDELSLAVELYERAHFHMVSKL